MKHITNGVDANKLFPGLLCVAQNDCRRLFAKSYDEEPTLIQVFGNSFLGEKGFCREVVATLKDKDCELYEVLKWQDWSREHPDVVLGQTFVLFATVIVLFVVQLVIFGFLYAFSPTIQGVPLPVYVFLSFCIAIGLSLLEVSLYDESTRMVKQIKAERKIDQWLLEHSKGEESSYVITLLGQLCNANDNDVALEASRALKRW